MFAKRKEPKEPAEEQQLSPEEERLFTEAAQLYEEGKYELAQEAFKSLTKNNRRLRKGVKPYLRFCDRVIKADTRRKADVDDTIREVSDAAVEDMQKVSGVVGVIEIVGGILLLPGVFYFTHLGYQSIPVMIVTTIAVGSGIILLIVAKRLRNISNLERPVKTIRCKWCGEPTPYINPNEGFAYLDSNNCRHCRRGYPMPSIAWDGEWGQTYMYERGSVTEKEFYKEFEKQHPKYPRSDMAKQILARKD